MLRDHEHWSAEVRANPACDRPEDRIISVISDTHGGREHGGGTVVERTSRVNRGPVGSGGSTPGQRRACEESRGPATDQEQQSAAQQGGAAQFSFAVTPATGAKSLPVSTEIGLKLGGGRVTGVELRRDGASGRIKGSLRDDGTSWVPAAPLAFGARYTATVTATSDDGARTETRTTTFSTMGRPGRETGTGLYLFSEQTYGVAMPVVVEFTRAIPESARAGVQRRLFVRSDPPQPGVWHWPSGTQVWYRPPTHWRPGTKLTVRIALGGHPTGGGYYGDADRSATVRIGQKVSLTVDNRTKRMSVYKGEKLVRTIPVSLGKRSTPSSSGQLVDHEPGVLDDLRHDP